jgi:hypothetical protein
MQKQEPEDSPRQPKPFFIHGHTEENACKCQCGSIRFEQAFDGSFSFQLLDAPGNFTG